VTVLHGAVGLRSVLTDERDRSMGADRPGRAETAAPHHIVVPRVLFRQPGAERGQPGEPAEFAASPRRGERCGHVVQNWTI
jgi:hypothetical protein